MSGGPFVCHACGAAPTSPDAPYQCPNRDTDGADHVLRRQISLSAEDAKSFGDDDPNPFRRFRRLSHSYRYAIDAGMTDAAYLQLVDDLTDAVEQVDGRRFRVTPFVPMDGMPAPQVWAKDETGNVAGSHKSRHLMGLLIWLTVLERLGKAPERAPLAIASCGNAAVAASTLARAVNWPIQVYVPPDGDPVVLEKLAALGADLQLCPREDDRPGDPCIHGFRDAVTHGAIPFTCQGLENALTLDGGMTLGYELASQMRVSRLQLDRLFVQVGGGALLSSVGGGLREAAQLGIIETLPRTYAVQTQGGAPLARAIRKLKLENGSMEDRLQHAIHRRADYMWPWETTPQSLATGILDDETYDWVTASQSVLETDGDAVVVDEPIVAAAHGLITQSLQPLATATGTAGMAGVLYLGGFRPDETVGILVTGAELTQEE